MGGCCVMGAPRCGTLGRAPRPVVPRERSADEPVCTPGSVPARGCPRAGDGHPSTTYVAARLQRSTRELGRAALERSLSDLAPGGVYRAGPVARSAGGLLHHRFTLTARAGAGASTCAAVCSLWHCPAGHPGWALPTTLPCGARTFLGGEVLRPAPTRPPDRLVRTGKGTARGASLPPRGPRGTAAGPGTGAGTGPGAGTGTGREPSDVDAVRQRELVAAHAADPPALARRLEDHELDVVRAEPEGGRDV